MKGDFSNLDYRPKHNYTGVLHQQGRGLLDQDGNAATEIERHLRWRLGQDTIGPRVVGVPAAVPDSLQVIRAESDGHTVSVRLNPGRAWVDGLHFYLPGQNPADFTATYYGPPMDSPAPDAGSIATGVRDAVILELWEESFSGFQAPQELLEPALGGPDTTERVKLAHAVRLLRLRDGEDCHNLDRLIDDPAGKGHLTVSPAPSLAIVGDCPVQAGGGYTGFEHALYRVEIAAPDAGGNARFKWSRYNGGLVGRGTYDNATDQVTVLANDQPINHAGRTDFHLEALVLDDQLAHWVVSFAATATLVADGRLQLTNITGAWPGTAAQPAAFLRLWDGIEKIIDFRTGLANPTELDRGVRLEFDPPAADNGNYRPGDYWTFPVRAAGVDFDPATWPTDAAPSGVRYHRAPLAVLNWDNGPAAVVTGPPPIHDCRQVFQPLTRRDTCCTYRVGDGIHSHGDFTSVQQAINQLPPDGGEVCVLPGSYEEHVIIESNNIHLHGCGREARIVAPDPGPNATPEPAIRITGASNVSVSNLAVQAQDQGIGVLVEHDVKNRRVPALIELDELEVAAAEECAVKVVYARQIAIRRCMLTMDDVASQWPALFLIGRDAEVIGNTIRVQRRKIIIEARRELLKRSATEPQAGRGGIQIGGTSERVRVIDNLIQYGIGNGITLGSLHQAGDGELRRLGRLGWVINLNDACDPCAPGGVVVFPGGGGGGNQAPTYQSDGSIYDLRIERNRIQDMGLNGIGVVAFFDLSAQDEFITVDGLEILRNTIEGCLWRDLEEPPAALQPYSGYGGVSLADVIGLVMHDNVIVDNGPDHHQPVCGVFILHGEGTDLQRNRIVNNGAKTKEPIKGAKSGRRGGINIGYAVPPTIPTPIGERMEARQNGVPAAFVHDNIVSQPLGQALSIVGVGPFSIVGNELASRGVVPGISSPSFYASTVIVLNLGMTWEFPFGQYLFRGTSSDRFTTKANIPHLTNDTLELGTKARGGLDDFGLGHYLADGNVLFANNQCVTDLLEPGASFSLSAALIVSLDDVGITGNQSDCQLRDDFLLANVIAAGASLRLHDNRLREGLLNAYFSAVTMGLLLHTITDNQCSHCLLPLRSPFTPAPGNTNPAFVPQHRYVDNIMLIDGFTGGGEGRGCDVFLNRFQQAVLVKTKQIKRFRLNQ